MFVRRNTDKLLIPIGILIFLVVISFHPKHHLRSEMPQGFFHEESRSEAGSKRPSQDERIAWAYWEAAQMEIQWRYPYSHPLPVDPPPEFHVDAAALGPMASDPSTRLLYWHRLQQVWFAPESWKSEYGWSLEWVGSPIQSGAQWIKEEFAHLTGG